jgi:Flp pilus assembly CpaE family ATPase
VERIGAIVDQLKIAFDFVILDVGRSLSKFTLPLLQQADLVVLVAGADLSSTMINKTLLDYLHTKGVENRSIYPILNRAVGLEGLTRAEAEKVLGLEIKTSIPYLPYLTLANNLHQPFTLKYPNDTAALVFRDIAGQMVALAQQIRAAKEAA